MMHEPDVKQYQMTWTNVTFSSIVVGGEEYVIGAVCELDWCISEKTLSKQYVIFMAYI